MIYANLTICSVHQGGMSSNTGLELEPCKPVCMDKMLTMRGQWQPCCSCSCELATWACVTHLERMPDQRVLGLLLLHLVPLQAHRRQLSRLAPHDMSHTSVCLIQNRSSSMATRPGWPCCSASGLSSKEVAVCVLCWHEWIPHRCK